MRTKTTHYKAYGRSCKWLSGMSLVECLVYIGLFSTVTSLALNVFFTCWDNSRAFRRAADDLSLMLECGERWRNDVRTANGPLNIEDSPRGKILRIPIQNGEVNYVLFANSVWRRTGTSGDWVQVSPLLKSSKMEADVRRQITAWKWEVELVTRRKNASILPLFTFEAVPQPQKHP